jgi:hypothetical protein
VVAVFRDRRETARCTAVGVCDPTIEGTCMRKPAFTKRTKIFPVTAVAGKVGNSEFATTFLLKVAPLMR